MTDAEPHNVQPKRITITLSADEHYLLRLLAFAAGVPVAAQAREAIRASLGTAAAAGTFRELAAPGLRPQLTAALARLEAAS
jgi:hypothetical protein